MRRYENGRGAGTLRIAKRSRLCFTGLLLAATLVAAGTLAAAADVIATEAKLEGDGQETVFSLTMTRGVTAEKKTTLQTKTKTPSGVTTHKNN